jgi:hypothetical protein
MPIGPRPRVTIGGTAVAAGDFILTSEPRADLVCARGLGWIVAAAPVTAAERRFLLDGDACVAVAPFADGDRLLVEGATLRVVRRSTRRVRVLDRRGATLESCRMDRSRTRVECVLDMVPESVRIDADGRVLSGGFTPLWLGGGAEGAR